MKLPFLNKKLLCLYSSIISSVLAIESFILIFVEIKNEHKVFALIINLAVVVIGYIISYIIALKLKERKIKIGDTKITIKFGDMFKEQGYKVIAANEYFDTIVNEKIISKNTLHGKVLSKHITNIESFDEALGNDNYCNSQVIGNDKKRPEGKTKKYKLGTCFKFENFIFVAFTKFDEFNKAYLSLSDYLFCLSNFWNEVNRVYCGENVIITLLGSGVTRITDGCNITKQEQLTMLIDTLRFSNVSFSHDSEIKIILPENLKDEISLFKV